MKSTINSTDLSTFLDSATMIYHKNIHISRTFWKRIGGSYNNFNIEISRHRANRNISEKTYFSICNDLALKISRTDTHPYKSKQLISKGKSVTKVRIISIVWTHSEILLNHLKCYKNYWPLEKEIFITLYLRFH